VAALPERRNEVVTGDDDDDEQRYADDGGRDLVAHQREVQAGTVSEVERAEDGYDSERRDDVAVGVEVVRYEVFEVAEDV
jgi:hypothetical protein